MDIELARSNQLVNLANERSPQQSGGAVAETDSSTETVNAANSVNALQANADTQSNDQEASNADIQSAAAQVSDFVQAQNRNLNFSFDDEAQRSIVKVTDSETGDLIRQIPSEEVLRLSERIQNLQSDVDSTVGVLFNKEV